MDSRDRGHMYFTNLFSQDPVTFDDSPPSPQVEPLFVRKSVRDANFISEKDKLLVLAWLNTSVDGIQGTEKKHAQVEWLNQSDVTEHEKFDKVKIMYLSLEKTSFQFKRCWYLLKDQSKWIQRCTKEGPKRRSTISPTSSAAINSICDIETKNVLDNDVIELEMSMGRKSEKVKCKAHGRPAEEIVELSKVKYTLQEESHAQEKEFFQLKA